MTDFLSARKIRGPELDMSVTGNPRLEQPVKHNSENPSSLPRNRKRAADRRAIALPARLTWKDQRGAARFASAVTRDISEVGVFVECQAGVTIPMFRLVQFQLERDARDASLPTALRQGRVLSAVYRVQPASGPSGRQGFALRLMVDPRRAVAQEITETRATA